MPAHLACPDERIAHRTWIGGAIKTLTVICGGDWPTDPRLEAEMGFMWANDLEGFPRSAIEAAITAYRRTESRRPTPAAIIALCRRERATVTVVERAPEQPRAERCSPQRAAEILAEFGYDREPTLASLVKRMTRSGEE